MIELPQILLRYGKKLDYNLERSLYGFSGYNLWCFWETKLDSSSQKLK